MNRRDALIDKHQSKAGLRGKIDAMCISCVYEEGQGGTWAQQIEACTVTKCPLFSVRRRSSTGKG
jgi:hypothetical protein